MKINVQEYFLIKLKVYTSSNENESLEATSQNGHCKENKITWRICLIKHTCSKLFLTLEKPLIDTLVTWLWFLILILEVWKVLFVWSLKVTWHLKLKTILIFQNVINFCQNTPTFQRIKLRNLPECGKNAKKYQSL